MLEEISVARLYPTARGDNTPDIDCSHSSRMRHSGIFGALLTDALTNGNMVRFRAEGTSMHPTIRDGETITVAAVATDDVVRGDVLLCAHGTRVLAHRVVGVTTCGAQRFFELRGDAKASCDGPIGASAVVARVINVARNGRLIRLCGRAARVRRRTRAALSRAGAFIVPTATVFFAVVLRAAAAADVRRR